MSHHLNHIPYSLKFCKGEISEDFEDFCLATKILSQFRKCVIMFFYGKSLNLKILGYMYSSLAWPPLGYFPLWKLLGLCSVVKKER